VATQLRKIMFSAFVYGALVVICLGGVVWGLTLAMPNVLPIHYTYNEPVLEFPVDLLFCNFLMPLAVKFFKPSDGLHAMYTWWFRKCASALRLTWFLFGERRIEEEGTLGVVEGSNRYRLWRSLFLGVNAENQVVFQRWSDFFGGGDAKPASKVSGEEMIVRNEQKRLLVESGQLQPDGRFVRSPASDQAKIPKGHPVFIDMSEEEIRQINETDRPETDLLSGNHYQVVYIPPWFRARIFVFILSIWIFAAVTGVSSTIVPLVFGRRIFKALVPPHIRTNDIYAFSIGVYVLSSASYLVFHLHSVIDKVRGWSTSIFSLMLDRHAVERAIQLANRTWRLTYAYTMLLLIFPILITVLVEMYVLIPLHTYMYSTGTGDALRFDGPRDGHTVRVIQAWTLGILYLKLGSRALTLYGGRPAQAVRAVLRRGWLEPDVGVLTRAFVIPGFIASAMMLFMPPMFARAALRWAVDNTPEVSYEMQVSAYRLAYPLTALSWVALFALRRLFRIFEGWQVRMRDEAYLMGERLHNFTGTATKASGWRGSTRM
jgi:E3 ubiquitin-protein ligase MARCH6